MAYILLCGSAVRVHDPQAYRKMDVTRERISRILELREMPLSSQTGFDQELEALDRAHPSGHPRQGCLLSPALFNIFLKRIMTDALEDHEGTVRVEGRTITNLRLAETIDGLAGEEEELAKLVERLDKASRAYGIEINAEKTKLMTNNTSGINTEIKANGQ